MLASSRRLPPACPLLPTPLHFLQDEKEIDVWLEGGGIPSHCPRFLPFLPVFSLFPSFLFPLFFLDEASKPGSPKCLGVETQVEEMSGPFPSGKRLGTDLALPCKHARIKMATGVTPAEQMGAVLAWAGGVGGRGAPSLRWDGRASPACLLPQLSPGSPSHPSTFSG